MALTLSIPEILKDVLEAFKLQTPEIFGPAGFSLDFSSKTAAIGDTLIAKIAHLPTTAAYDPTPGVGFYSGVQEVTSLIEDVPVTLNQLRHVPVRIKYLTSLATKGVPLYQAAISNIGCSLGRYVVNSVLAEAAAGVSNSVPVTPALCNLDTFDGDIRNLCNAQRMATNTRWAFISTPLAESLGCDDRVRSSLYFDSRNGNEGLRRWVNVGGMNSIREYPDITLAGNQVAGICGDRRLAAVSVRRIENASKVAEELGIRKVMEFYPLRDEESGLELTGIGWQESGSADVIVSCAILFGVHCGNGGGAAGSMTDSAGLKLIAM